MTMPSRPGCLSPTAFANIAACTDVAARIRAEYVRYLSGAGTDLSQAQRLHDVFRRRRKFKGRLVTLSAIEGLGNLAPLDDLKKYSYAFFNRPGRRRRMTYAEFRATVDDWIEYHENQAAGRPFTTKQNAAALDIEARTVIVRDDEMIWLFRNPGRSRYAFDGLLDDFLRGRLGLLPRGTRVTLSFKGASLRKTHQPTFLDATWDYLDFWDAGGEHSPDRLGGRRPTRIGGSRCLSSDFPGHQWSSEKGLNEVRNRKINTVSKTRRKAVGSDPATRLAQTIQGEDPQKLITLMQEARSPERRTEFVKAVKALVTGAALEEKQWHNLEYFVIEADLTDGSVRDCLESIQTKSELTLDARISVYSMLQRCGSARLLAMVSADTDLNLQNPEIWMDLVAASTPETTAALRGARHALLTEVTAGKLGGRYLLERMRLITKLAIGAEDEWLSRLLGALPPGDVGVEVDAGDQWDAAVPTHSLEALAWSKHIRLDYWNRHATSRIRMPSSTAEARAVEEIRLNGMVPQRKPWVTTRDALSGLSAAANEWEPSGHWQHPGARAYAKHTGSVWDEPAKALKAGNHGVPGGENMIALGKGRVRYFTIREMARLQGLPDDFIVCGSWKAATRQLGNAVPTAVGARVGAELKAILDAVQSKIDRTTRARPVPTNEC
jgi:hypothetical protein